MKNDKIQQSIKFLENEGYKVSKIEDNSEWIDVPELGIQVEREVHDKNKSWDDLKLSEREDELLTYDQCIFLMNSTKYNKILKMDGSSSNDDFFIKQYSDLSKSYGYVAGFYAVSGCSDLNSVWDSDYSSSDLGVRFARKKNFKVGKK